MSPEKRVRIRSDMTIYQLSKRLELEPAKIIRYLFAEKRVARTLNQSLSMIACRELAIAFGYEIDDSEDGPDENYSKVPKTPIAPIDSNEAKLKIPKPDRADDEHLTDSSGTNE